MTSLHGRRSASFSTLFFYICREAAFSFFVAFLFFFFIFFINQLLLMAEEILSKRVPFAQVALLVLYSLPAIVAMAAPFAALVGILMAIGRMNTDNEILLIRLSGLSYSMLFLPLILVGVLISLISFFANDVLLPAGTLEFGKLYRKLLFSTPAIELESNSVKRFKDTVLITGDVLDKSIDKILILDRTPNGERRVILADKATLENESNSLLSLRLDNAFIHTSTENTRMNYDYALSGQLRYALLQSDIMQAISAPGPREMASRDVAKEIKLKALDLKKNSAIRMQRAFKAAADLELILRNGSSGVEWNKKQTNLDLLKRERSSSYEILNDRTLRVYKLEYYKKFSIPFGALSFVFLATPLGLFAKKSGQTVGFALGLIIAVLYWALLIGGQTLGVRLGYSPFWAMWLPNISVVFTGLVLTIWRFKR